MTFVKVVDGVVVQKQPYFEAGFVAVDAGVVCGMLLDGEKYVAPPAVPKTQKQIDTALKLAGVDYDGVMYSATREDSNGLLAVSQYVSAGGSSVMNFSNGAKLMITPANVAAFGAVWMPFRASFFK